MLYILDVEVFFHVSWHISLWTLQHTFVEDVKQQQSTASVVTGTFFNEYIVPNIPNIIVIIFAVFLIRKSKRGEICELWNKKLHDQA